MGRLFWKILVSFWLTMILTNVGALWIFSLVVSDPDRMPAGKELSGSDSRVSAVSLVLEQKGLAATRALLEEFGLSSPISIFAIDNFGLFLVVCRPSLSAPSDRSSLTVTHRNYFKTLCLLVSL